MVAPWGSSHQQRTPPTPPDKEALIWDSESTREGLGSGSFTIISAIFIWLPRA